MKKLLILACAAIALLACNQPPASMENPTIQTIMTRVSVREFTGEKISEAQIDTLLRAAMAAPSAINKQPWAFIVVTDEAKIAQLGDSLPNSRCSNHPAVAIIPCGDLSRQLAGLLCRNATHKEQQKQDMHKSLASHSSMMFVMVENRLQRYGQLSGMADSFLTIGDTALLNDDFLFVVILAELRGSTAFVLAEQAVEIGKRVEA